MAKPLVFRLKGKEYPLEPVKLDRKKLYGWTEIERNRYDPWVSVSLRWIAWEALRTRILVVLF